MTGDARQPVQIASIPTLKSRLDWYPAPTLYVPDEAHHCSAATWSTVLNHYRDQGTKIVGLSATPANKDTSRIDAEFKLGDQRYYNVACDGCGTLQPIKWSQIRWPKGQPEKAVFACAHCGHEHEEHRKTVLMDEDNGACWIATAESTRTNLRSYHISALYSPWYTWAECVRDFLSAKDDPAKLQPFINTVLGEPWEDRTGETVDPDSLYAKREDYSLLPAQTAILTAGIDVQPDRLELELVAWGRAEESWNIDYQIFPGDPSSNEVWEILDEYLQRRWPHPAYDNGMKISATCIDTGGSNTQSVYRFVGPREGRRIWGIKGYAGPLPVWPRRPSRNNKGKINLYRIGVDSAKETITARFRKSGPNASGAGATHFHRERDREYFEQLTAERKVTRFHKGFKKTQWEKGEKDRNEALDCRVYAYAALQGLFSAGVVLDREAKLIADRLAERGVEIAKPEPVQEGLPEKDLNNDTMQPARQFAKTGGKSKRRRSAQSSYM